MLHILHAQFVIHLSVNKNKNNSIMKKIFALLLLAIALLAPSLSFAGRGHGSYKSSSTRSSHTKTYVPKSEKTVHVKSYTRKDGTHVDAYNRRPPNSVRKEK